LISAPPQEPGDERQEQAHAIVNLIGAPRTIVLGDFNDWSPTTDPMTDDNSDGEWTLFYPLAPGSYAYKFVVDGKNWVPDPSNPLSEPDGFNGRNSILKIPAGS